MTARTDALCRSASISSRVKPGRKNRFLSRAALREVGADFRAHLLDVGGPRLRMARRHRRGGALRRTQREVDAFPGDGVDEARGVPDEQPAGPGRLQPFEVDRRQRRNRPGVGLELGTVGEMGPRDPAGDDLPQAASPIRRRRPAHRSRWPGVPDAERTRCTRADLRRARPRSDRWSRRARRIRWRSRVDLFETFRRGAA